MVKTPINSIQVWNKENIKPPGLKFTIFLFIYLYTWYFKHCWLEQGAKLVIYLWVNGLQLSCDVIVLSMGRSHCDNNLLLLISFFT